jgi:D-serine deaminase-like pyridoxal phosphate-dependent protein
MDLLSIPTPALVLDRQKLRSNLSRMQQHAAKLGVRLRPHLKTAKSAEVARLATAGTFGGIAVSTIAEAEYFLSAGFSDILYAVGIVPSKADRLLDLQRGGAQISITLDCVEVAEGLEQRLTAIDPGGQKPFDVLIEIDADGHRNGVTADGGALLAIAAALRASRRLRLIGLMSHAGESYRLRSPHDIADLAERERAVVTLASARLRTQGYDCPVISVGSTPTATYARDLTGVTELRVGVYMFGDLFQAGLGCCSIEDLAVSVLATVIHHKPDLNRMLVDAGALALSKDRGTATQDVDFKYGLVADICGHPSAGVERRLVDDVNQEHGLIATAIGPADFKRYPIDSRIRVLPNHACMTAAAHERYFVTDGDTTVVDVWERCHGW